MSYEILNHRASRLFVKSVDHGSYGCNEMETLMSICRFGLVEGHETHALRKAGRSKSIDNVLHVMDW